MIDVDPSSRSGSKPLVVVRFKVQSQPDRSEQVLGALRDVVEPSRALPGTISFDIGRDVADPDSFIATEVFEDQAALERQEALPEVAKGLGVLETSLVRDPRRPSSACLLPSSGDESAGRDGGR